MELNALLFSMKLNRNVEMKFWSFERKPKLQCLVKNIAIDRDIDASLNEEIYVCFPVF